MRAFAPGNRIIGPDRESTVGELIESGGARFARWRGKTVAFNTPDPVSWVEALLAAAIVGFELAVAPAERFTDDWRARLRSLVHELAREEGGELQEEIGDARGSVDAGILLFTTGSSGPPKPVRHSFETADTFSGVDVEPHRWLVTYLPGTYAWVQIVMLGLVVPDQTLIFPAPATVDWLAIMKKQSVTAVPSTPTFWRYLLAVSPRSDLQALPMHRITLGGERADQAILDDLRETFPAAVITHVFATTETGPAIAVSDGLSGFPASYLDRPLLGGRVRLRIGDGTLWVRSPYTHAGASTWLDTGDIAEVDGDRVHIRGRVGLDSINVGGYNVGRGELEDFVRSIDGVLWARVFPVRAPLVGTLVGLDLVIDRGTWPDEEAAELAIVNACRKRLSEYHAPRVVRILDEVPLGKTLKTAL